MALDLSSLPPLRIEVVSTRSDPLRRAIEKGQARYAECFAAFRKARGWAAGRFQLAVDGSDPAGTAWARSRRGHPLEFGHAVEQCLVRVLAAEPWPEDAFDGERGREEHSAVLRVVDPAMRRTSDEGRERYQDPMAGVERPLDATLAGPALRVHSAEADGRRRVIDAFQEEQAVLSDCLWYRHGRRLDASVRLELHVDAGGRVAAATMRPGPRGDPPPPVLADCTARVVRRLQLPRAEEAETVRFVLDVGRGRDQAACGRGID